MRGVIAAVALACTVFLGSSVAQAAPQKSGQQASSGACPVCTKASDEMASYPAKAGNTLVRGAANTLLGWTELIRQPANEVKGGGNFFTGVAKGVGQGVKRTLVGAAEVVTFWTPKMQGSYLHFAEDCPLCMGKH